VVLALVFFDPGEVDYDLVVPEDEDDAPATHDDDVQHKVLIRVHDAAVRQREATTKLGMSKERSAIKKRFSTLSSSILKTATAFMPKP